MHDPMTVICSLPRYPRSTIVTIWHVDPERDGSDDSCGWFMRARHCDPAVLARIVKRFESDWDRTRTSEESGDTYYEGFFEPVNGLPIMSPSATALGLFQLAAIEHFGGRDKAMPFLQRNLAEILIFAENRFDSMRDYIVQRYGAERRDHRIEHFATMIYSWILRAERPWYRHPRWHVHHWSIQIHPWQTLRRWLFSRCCKCGKRFAWGYSPCTDMWDSPKPRLFRSEVGIYHSDCRRPDVSASQWAAAD